jgi:hypothetical protein
MIYLTDSKKRYFSKKQTGIYSFIKTGNMRKKLLLSCSTAFLLGAALFTSCEGPAGPAGVAGKDGKDGTDGTDGVDASSTCVQCHSDKGIIVDHKAQVAYSMHIAGTTIEEAGRNGCAPCHSSQGYRDVLAHNPPLSAYNTSTLVSSPVQIGDCYTCHNVHETGDSSDWSFTGGASFHMLIDSANLVINRGEINNLCSRCHQPRRPSPFPSVANLAAAIDIKSYRYGPHYGAQGAMNAGKGGFLLSGSETYADGDSPHADASCADCHMVKLGGPFVGGHTLGMQDIVSGADNIAACKQCHTTSGKDFDFNGGQSTIEGLLADLGTALDLYLEKEDGVYTGYLDIYDPSSNPNGRYQATPGSSWTQEQKDANTALPLLKNSGFTNLHAAAFVNFMLVTKDKSMGVHNYPYIHALLQNTLESLAAI